jgi:hypothetical protein
MNSDKMILPDFLIAALYKDSLVDLDNFSPSLNSPEAKESLLTNAGVNTLLPGKIKYLGENIKNVTIVVNQPDHTYLNKEDHTFLINILKACQLSQADIAIVNVGKEEVTYTALKEQLNALQILLFDVEPSVIKLPFKIPAFQVQNFSGCTILTAPALSALNKQDNQGRILKTKLWNSLKEVFNIT